ncbi:MAG: methylmalonyl-CoA epimerase [Pseudomonadota bacterium]
MKINRIAHLGLAVSDLEAAMSFFTEGLPLQVTHTEEYQGMKIAFIPIGDSSVELLQDVSGASAIKKFLDKNGEGLHHIAYEVDDINQAISELKAKGIRMIDEKPRHGAHGMSVAFMHPKATHGVLMELCQPSSDNH